MTHQPASSPPPANVQLSQVGQPIIRTDAPGKAFGTTTYAGDIVMPNMLHGVVVRADRASATIAALDVSKAKALPGVHTVLTAEDLPERLVMTDIPGQTGGKTKDTAQPMLARERVKFQGEAIALIAAETLDIAHHARDLVEVTYDDYPGVFDPVEALKPDAPKVYGDDNVIASYRIRRGDVGQGFAEADHIIENTFKTPYQEQAFLEPEAGIAWVDEHDVINIRVSTQVVEHFRSIADALGLPHNKVHLKAEYVGGGFGGKENITVETYLALLALRSRRPVKLVLPREESFLAHGKRHPFTFTHKTGVTKDGKITAAEVKVTGDGGPYATLSPYVLLYATISACGPYRIDNIAIDSVAAATNNLQTDAFRGFGAMQACCAYEQQMDEIAKLLGMDRLELRKRNYLKTGEANATGQVVESAVWSEQCATAALEALGEPTPAYGAVKIGRGFANYQQSYGRIRWFKDSSEAWVGIEVDGAVTVRSAVTDIGAGQSSALAQIAAEVLGVPMDRVLTYFGDTALNPLAGTISASRALYMSGNAVKLAATHVRDNLLAWASEHFEVPADAFGMRDDKVFVIDAPERSMSIPDLVKACASASVHRHDLAIFRAPPSEGLDPETGQGDVFPDFTFGAHAVEVAVDIETGEVTVLKSVGAHDVGQAVNPRAVEGQIEGSALMGQGFALSEEMLIHEGKLVTPSFSEYLMPTSEDVPEITSIILESRSGLGPYGAKGIGEPAYAPVAASIANAVADAIGIRIKSLPITPERVVANLALHGPMF